jgi:hypothetical protein
VALTFSDCTFAQCHTVNAGLSGDGAVACLLERTVLSLDLVAGGAILWGPVAAAASLTINGQFSQSIFSLCSARRGGAVMLSGQWGAQVAISDTSFTNCSALESGGALSTLSR